MHTRPLAAVISPAVSGSAGGHYAASGRAVSSLWRVCYCNPVPEQVVDPDFFAALVGCFGGAHVFVRWNVSK